MAVGVIKYFAVGVLQDVAIGVVDDVTEGVVKDLSIVEGLRVTLGWLLISLA